MKEVWVYGTIGYDIMASIVQYFPKGKFSVRINSLGGDVFTARVIANAIAARRDDVTAVIDGVAASAATMIALAAGRVEMADNAQFMIHNPRATAYEQQSDELRSTLKSLDDIEAEYVAAYVGKSGLGEKKVRAMMDAETWLNATEALSLGFVDEIIPTRLELAAMAKALPFDRFKYQNPPKLVTTHTGRGQPQVKTKLSAFIAQLLAKLATDQRPQSALLAEVAAAAGADPAVIQAIADGMLSIVPTQKTLEAFATVLDSDIELLKAEAAANFDAFKTAPKQRVQTNADGSVVDLAGAIRTGEANATRRAADIQAMFRPYPQHANLAIECIATGKTVEESTRLLLEAVRSNATPIQVPGTAALVTEDGVDKMVAGITFALMARGDQAYRSEHRAELARNEFYGMTLAEMCRESLRRNGQEYRGHARDIVGRAFMAAGSSAPGTGTGSFPTILEDIANKFVHQGWTSAPETWRAWVAVRSMNDFKAHSFMNLSEFDDLLLVPERGEFVEGLFKEAGEKATLATYGRLFSISRQAVINDDADAFTSIPMKMGRAAARIVGDLAYGVLTANANMADGTALFHANHGNLRTGAGAPASSIADAIRVLMGTQTDPNGKKIYIRPQTIICPVALEGGWRVVMQADSAVDLADSASKASRIPNSVKNMANVVADPRLDANSAVASYFSADPQTYPAVIMGFLNGQDAPFVDQQDGWTIDGTSFKVRMDAVAKAIDWRALAKNAGA